MTDTDSWTNEKQRTAANESKDSIEPEESQGPNSSDDLAGGEEDPPSDPEKQQHVTAKPSVPPPPNGGYGWVNTVCTAFINAHTWGLNSSYGVFLAHYLANDTFPGATPLEYAFVGSLSIGCAMLISPVATTTTRYLGTHVTLSIGVVLETASLIGASFAKEIWQLFLSQGICFGLGMGFLFIGSVPIVPQWFTTKRYVDFTMKFLIACAFPRL